jgi:hypothetical protein
LSRWRNVSSSCRNFEISSLLIELLARVLELPRLPGVLLDPPVTLPLPLPLVLPSGPELLPEDIVLPDAVLPDPPAALDFCSSSLTFALSAASCCRICSTSELLELADDVVPATGEVGVEVLEAVSVELAAGLGLVEELDTVLEESPEGAGAVLTGGGAGATTFVSRSEQADSVAETARALAANRNLRVSIEISRKMN